MASTVGDEQAGNEDYQTDHMSLLFNEGLSFSGYERDHLYLNLEGEKFTDISGVSSIDSISDGRAALLADFDNDGDLDVFVTTIQNEGHLLFRNNVGQDNHFIRVGLEGKESGKDAFGTVVRVKAPQGILTSVKSGGSGFLAQHDPRLLFGLGKAERAEWIEIAWSSGKVQRLGPIEAGSSIRVIEGREEPLVVPDQFTRLVDPFSPDQALWHKLKIAQGGELPPLVLKSLEGMDALLTPGVPYFLNLWATWCLPCREEMPELEHLYSDFKEKGIELVGLSVDLDVEPSYVGKYATDLGVSYPLYMADEESVFRIFDREVFIPFSILVDEKGKVAQVFEGWSARSQRRILELLEGP
ncbi:MAG: ASPIC/UnbV domain-containing protein [Candidatus Binatia bacterium]|nr:ASPIC/UnbV domain-containing protein [Candidatus Binatia bacterium]